MAITSPALTARCRCASSYRSRGSPPCSWWSSLTLRVTLSYFIEPSPGRIGWTRKHRYQSHGLRFDVNRPTENEEAFRQRLSRAEWEEDQRPDNTPESRDWVIGDRGRRRGSLHNDSWTGPAADLATSNMIGIYPVTGWWRERAHLGQVEMKARYSLIVSIEAPGIEVDLYTPIMTQASLGLARQVQSSWHPTYNLSLTQSHFGKSEVGSVDRDLVRF